MKKVLFLSFAAALALSVTPALANVEISSIGEDADVWGAQYSTRSVVVTNDSDANVSNYQSVVANSGDNDFTVGSRRGFHGFPFFDDYYYGGGDEASMKDNLVDTGEAVGEGHILNNVNGTETQILSGDCGCDEPALLITDIGEDADVDGEVVEDEVLAVVNDSDASLDNSQDVLGDSGDNDFRVRGRGYDEVKMKRNSVFTGPSGGFGFVENTLNVTKTLID